MPVGLRAPEQLSPIAGIRLGVAAAGIRKSGKADLLLLEIAEGASAAAVFTRNQFCAAPVIVAREHLAIDASPRALLVNAGNANAGTGDSGIAAARTSCRAVGASIGCAEHRVLPFSTGVIGEPLPVERIEAALPRVVANCDADNWLAAAHAIMTTDTVAKGWSVTRTFNGATLTVTGIAKGAGMIRPDMATMLAYVATDAAVPPALLQRLLMECVDESFNRVTIDGDTSTNDACVLVATGAGDVRIDDMGAGYAELRDAVAEVCRHLAQAIVRDGEGATKFVTVAVEQGASKRECLQVAYTVAHSPLVKTALFASDPNWGRILAAVGRAGVVDLDVHKVAIFLDPVCIVEGGGRAKQYTEEQGRQVMAQEEILIRVVLGRGDAAERIWTSDFSYDYVRINAEYRT